jgi:hypothetical protein
MQIAGKPVRQDDSARAEQLRVGKRREIRIPVRLVATLAEPGEQPIFVQLADLSRGGARCQSLRTPPVGAAVELGLDGLKVEAVVRWVSGVECGLSFATDLRATVILIQSGKSRRLPVDAPDPPRLFNPSRPRCA